MLVDRVLLDWATRPVAPTLGMVDVSELRFDKMSNEGSESANPRTKIRLGGFRGILRRFAKCTLLHTGALERHYGRC